MSDPNTRALVVEDDPSWLNLLAEILTDAGLTVDTADNLGVAVAVIRRAPHQIAVVDLCLGGDNHRNREGLKVLDALKSYDPGCVSVLLTGYATVEIAVSVLTEHGAFTCLRKENFTRAEFREVVRKALVNPSRWTSIAPAQPAGSGASPEDAPVDGPELPGGTALVVEDDAGWRSILSELLTGEGYDVHGCNGLGDALGYLGRIHYDLAVVDLSLAGHPPPPQPRLGDGLRTEQDLGGYRLLACTLANGIPTIVVSGVATPPEIERLYADYGIFVYLEKQTFDRQAFRRVVGNLQTSGQADSELSQLTDRQRQVLVLLSRGMTNKDIAEALMISPNTVKRHLKVIFKTLGVHTRAAAVAKALNQGITGRENITGNERRKE